MFLIVSDVQEMTDSTAVQVVAARPRKVIAPGGRGRAALNKVPDNILDDQMTWS